MRASTLGMEYVIPEGKGVDENCVPEVPLSSCKRRNRDCHQGSLGVFAVTKFKYVGLGGRNAR